jgi:hypothetical protein
MLRLERNSVKVEDGRPLVEEVEAAKAADKTDGEDEVAAGKRRV